MRACLGNQFEDNECCMVKTSSFISKQKIYKSVSFTLEQLTLGALKEMILANQSVFKDIIELSNLETNLEALRILRNKVSHHNFLFIEKFAECVVNGEADNSLKHNIINLQNFLPIDYRQGFANTINNCANGLEITKCISIK